MKRTRGLSRPQGRTPLFRKLRESIRLARIAGRRGSRDLSAIVEEHKDSLFRSAITRRDFLRGAAASALAVAPFALTGCSSKSHRQGSSRKVVIVGAGMAGLNAAYTLRKSGIYADIYEGSNRIGGRIFTAHNLLAKGLTTELGGEFIDSIHDDMLALVDEFGLELMDTFDPSETGLLQGYFFNGLHYTEAQVLDAFVPLAARIEKDYNSTGEVVDYQNDGGATRLDNLSIEEYLDRIGASGFIRKLLEVAYVTEYGLDIDQQSALNLIFLIGTDTSEGFEIFGESDERYKIKGGNDLVVKSLASRVSDQIETECILESLRSEGTGYRLTFRQGLAMNEVFADIVLLAIPFSVLREIDLRVDLPPFKEKAIGELGYGTSSKLLIGCSERIWRSQGYVGAVYSDQPFQLGWDSSQLQPGTSGGFTLFSGGRPGVEVGSGSVESQIARLLPGLELAFPGVSKTLNGNHSRFFWPGYQFSKGSYSAYRPGQWTTIAGAEFVPVGGLFFAGEHCSYEFQGYMNGAAETGRRAAERILQMV